MGHRNPVCHGSGGNDDICKGSELLLLLLACRQYTSVNLTLNIIINLRKLDFLNLFSLVLDGLHEQLQLLSHGELLAQ